LGMNKNSFNSLVRPAITTIPIGKRAIAFDRYADGAGLRYQERADAARVRDERCEHGDEERPMHASSIYQLVARTRWTERFRILGGSAHGSARRCTRAHGRDTSPVVREPASQARSNEARKQMGHGSAGTARRRWLTRPSIPRLSSRRCNQAPRGEAGRIT
jgi:hypothetical protein